MKSGLKSSRLKSAPVNTTYKLLATQKGQSTMKLGCLCLTHSFKLCNNEIGKIL
jgi:hypothetical protein